MRSPRLAPATLALALLIAAIPIVAGARRAAGAETDTLHFEPVPLPEDSDDVDAHYDEPFLVEATWLQPPFRAPLSNVREPWDVPPPGTSHMGLVLDYNRVDGVRLGPTYQAQARWPMSPRLGLRLEYATGRRRWLYGAQIEQPLMPGDLVALGFSLTRATDHPDLQQVGNLENSLALLVGRQDYRDYFEREGLDGYLAARWPGVTTLSFHGRNDRYRSLDVRSNIRSLFHQKRALRENPEVAEGEAHALAVRLERVLPGEIGFHHWIELERAGHGLDGDFEYTRLLADVRALFKLSPTMTFGLRLVGGSEVGGELPPQRAFMVGGVDGLRAHRFAEFRGNQMAMVQAEYSAGLGRFRTGRFENGLHAIVFVDAGHAWTHDDHWDVAGQRFAVDGGFGLATAEDRFRVYFAKNLQDPDSDFAISARLQRPF